MISGLIKCLWGPFSISVSPFYSKPSQDSISVFYQNPLNKRHTQRGITAQPYVSDKGDITYSRATINLENTEEITNKRDGAEWDIANSLKWPLWPHYAKSWKPGRWWCITRKKGATVFIRCPIMLALLQKGRWKSELKGKSQRETCLIKPCAQRKRWTHAWPTKKAQQIHDRQKNEKK